MKEARGLHQSSPQYRKTRNDVELSCGPLELSSSSSSWKCIESIVLGKRQQLNFLRDLCLDRRQYHRLLVGDTDLVHLVVASNLAQLPGLRALVRSAYKNTKTPSKLQFHIFQQSNNFTESGGQRNGSLDLESLHMFVREVGGQPLRLHYFRKEEVEMYINEHYIGDAGNVKRRENDLRSPENYVRFILADRLEARKVGYLDTDIIIQGDVVEFANQLSFKGGDRGERAVILAAFPRHADKIGDKVRKILRNHNIDPAPPFPGFNAGIMFIDLQKWRAENITEKMGRICRLNGKMRLWTKLGSQSPWLVMFTGDRFQHLDKSLMIGELGNNPVDHPQLKQINPKAMFLHWSGSNKPWADNARYLEFWSPYSIDS